MRRIVGLIAAFTLLLTACGGDDEQPSAGGGQGQPEKKEAGAVTIAVASSDLGDILVDLKDETLYMFLPDRQQNGKPTCYDDCAQTWPAFEATGDSAAGEGLDESLLGSVERRDGTTQVTYNDLPLYHFSGDEAAGDINGQGLNDVWWVVSSEGEPVKDEPTGGGGGYGSGG
ncbi:lipoprotein [soil metagenome]